MRVVHLVAMLAAQPSPPVPRLPESSWQVRSYEATIRYDTAQLRADFWVRFELVNDGPAPADSASVWLWPAFALDSARSGGSRIRLRTADGVSRMALPQLVQPQGTVAVTFFYHLGAEAAALPAAATDFTPDGVYIAWDWLPRVQPVLDSAGQVVRAMRSRFRLTFDVPAAWRAIAPGRATSDLAASGRRRTTWATEDVVASTPAFALGPYRKVSQREAGLEVALWLSPDDTVSEAITSATAAAVRDAWIFCSRAFGRLPIVEFNVVSTKIPETRGFAGLLLSAGAEPSRDRVLHEVARTWWGNSVDAAGPGSWWILEGFPAWVAVAVRGAIEGDTVRQRLVRETERRWRARTAGESGPPLVSLAPGAPASDLLSSKGPAALEAARRAAGDASFREAMLSLALDHRNGWITLDDVLNALGPDARAVLRPYLY